MRELKRQDQIVKGKGLSKNEEHKEYQSWRALPRGHRFEI